MELTDKELALLQLRICLEGAYCFLEGLALTQRHVDDDAFLDALAFVKEKFMTALELLDKIIPSEIKEENNDN